MVMQCRVQRTVIRPKFRYESWHPVTWFVNRLKSRNNQSAIRHYYHGHGIGNSTTNKYQAVRIK